MSQISSNLNLAALKHSRKMMAGISGPIDCIVIPIEANHLVIGEKGLYLNISHIEIKNPAPNQKDTHLVKQNMPKPIYDAMTDEERKSQPILGNSIVWGARSFEPALHPITDGDEMPF